MPRSRNIKYGFFTNEILGEADPIYSLLFAGLWTLADREGRLENRPKKIKAQLFPYRFDLDLSLALDWLNHESFITVYEIKGESYIQIENWRKHQTPHHKEVDSTIPPKPKQKKQEQKQEVAHDQSKHDSTLTQDQANKNASCPTDSLLLIPDSLDNVQQTQSVSPFESMAKEIFDYWCQVMDKKRSVFSPKRKLLITKRLMEGYTPQDIRTAILNCSNTPHNMGQNDNGKKYNDIELICRSPEKLEQFRDNPGKQNNYNGSTYTPQPMPNPED